METVKIEGQLEIDYKRGVIYFHGRHAITLLRICQLPTPIPQPPHYKSEPCGGPCGRQACSDGCVYPPSLEGELLDIIHMHGVSW